MLSPYRSVAGGNQDANLSDEIRLNLLTFTDDPCEGIQRLYGLKEVSPEYLVMERCVDAPLFGFLIERGGTLLRPELRFLHKDLTKPLFSASAPQV